MKRIIGVFFILITSIIEIAVIVFVDFLKSYQQVENLDVQTSLVVLNVIIVSMGILAAINIISIFFKGNRKVRFLYFSAHWLLLMFMLLIIKLPVVLITVILFIAIIPVYYSDYDEIVYWKSPVK